MASVDESPSAYGAPRAGGIGNARGKYFLLFGILFLILNLVNLDVENRSDYGMARIERMQSGSNFFGNTRLSDEPSSQFAKELNVTQDELDTADRVVDKFMERLDARGVDYWSRVSYFEVGDYRFHFGANLFVNFLVAFFIATGYHVRERLAITEDLVDYQQRRYQRLDQQLESRIGEISRILDHLNKLQDKLFEAEKLASIGRLSATLAHEIRNPLTIIKASTDIIMDDLHEQGGSASAVGLIRDEVGRMDRIITDLLNFARPKKPMLEQHELCVLVRHWLPPVVEELEKVGIQLVPRLDKFSGQVRVDADQLYQVFLNLVWNARDALAGVGNPHIFVSVDEGGDSLNLIIQDTGPGMLPEVLKQVREPFFTTKAQGTGLGIPVSVQLIEGMGGKFVMESELEFGTTVTLMLPRAGRRGVPDSIDSQLDEHLKKVMAQSSPGIAEHGQGS
ncbi:hypothetical protein IT570_03220 [Candidatus Sumerlaeota bacterium]|nr:hypothetical protein [Candidatus Sumerlaeota bacterium]